jgi:cysteinyl-tRNA synthetase
MHTQVKIPTAVTDLCKMRASKKEAGDWIGADKIRSQIRALGYTTHDQKNGEVSLVSVPPELC